MNRKQHQTEMLFKAGQFLGPLLAIVSEPTRSDVEDRRRIHARLVHDATAFLKDVDAFCSGEAGCRYMFEYERILHAVDQLRHSALTLIMEPMSKEWLNGIRRLGDTIMTSIASVPIPIDSAIYDAHTPFSTYCFVRDLCETASKRITWLDRFFDSSVFYRFFRNLQASAVVTLVTSPYSSATNRKDKLRADEFRDLSKLFAAERGPTHYRLIESTAFHDRWLQTDSKMFSLGGSIKDLQTQFTISRLDSTRENEFQFDEAVSKGVEVFGSSQTAHP